MLHAEHLRSMLKMQLYIQTLQHVAVTHQVVQAAEAVNTDAHRHMQHKAITVCGVLSFIIRLILPEAVTANALSS